MNTAAATPDTRAPRPRSRRRDAASSERAIGVGAARARVLALDREASVLARAKDASALSLARRAAAFIGRRSWSHFGFARLDDCARERLGRSGRWVRDLAALGKGIESFPALGAALTGEDGATPLGRVAALLVSKVATEATVESWIARARAVSVRRLRELVREARATSEAADVARPVDDEPRAQVSLALPAAVSAAFDEALDLYRAIEGSEAPVAGFVEALVAESMASVTADVPDVATSDCVRGPGLARLEASLERVADGWRWLGREPGERLDETAEIHGVLREADRGPRADPADLMMALRAAIASDDALDRRLGRVLGALGAAGGWAELWFSGPGHYAEERLGIARTTAEDRVRLARSLGGLPLLREAYETGVVGLESALLARRVLGGGPVDPEIERAWVERAKASTVRRLRDEAKALRLGRARRGLVHGRVPLAPLDDRTWHESLHRRAGTAAARMRDLTATLDGLAPPDVLLRLRLPEELAVDLTAAVESARAGLSRQVDSVPWHEPWPEPDPRGSVRLARTFSIRCRRVPSWIGLLALLEDFIDTWDAVDGSPRRRSDAVYERAGFRCEAPGCTSRRHLEDHHVLYRSRGGDHGLPNRICLCRFHHQMGEHGGLASCSGRAPLGVLWRLGAEEVGAWFRNDLRVA